LLIVLLLVSGIVCLPVAAAHDDSKATDETADGKAGGKPEGETDGKSEVKKANGKKARAKKPRSAGRGLKDTDPSQAQSITEEIKSRIKLYEKAFDEGDAKTIAGMWTENGTYTDPDGVEYIGRDNIEQAFSRFFKAMGTPPISLEIKSLRPIGDSAVEERGIASIRGQDGKLLPGTAYTTIHVKDNGDWRIASATERGPVAPRVPLTSLSWLVGDWKASGQTGQSSVTTKWEGDKHFIVCKFNSKSTNGKENNDIQVIGVDPISGQIVSWIFDSEGGTGNGRWWRVGDHWMADLNIVEADGTKFTATDIIAPSGPNSFTWQSVNRRIDGLPTGSTEKVTVDRVR
jgi:conserved hypothetical protein